ncbi:uncharacterized protein LACBIDRAFT_312723 [Laccaria bicolor S238N-H82]|uniref:Predicted protein n=1 Tax=Laccaria bicolor (strain S238N-H82 / ATCC MYA-4686) TaxID=486041 RepID=B0DWT4_LACBS|nr:uncharacterized protein LACBIDRAFT_312723 [Laccaria bicolor S238N-H82]EDR00985.1 predicted protein [Laccaria bicolor S238N-H82]|eukprot:XP_001888380.1 predicted protein [Laccaria bicolor S238N-H82]
MFLDPIITSINARHSFPHSFYFKINPDDTSLPLCLVAISLVVLYSHNKFLV